MSCVRERVMKIRTQRQAVRKTGYSAVWLARLIWDQEVAGSNPVTPIINDMRV